MPLLFSVPIAANQSPPLPEDGGDVGEGLDVVDERGAAPQTGLRRIGRPRARRAPAALDRRDQRRLLAADERAGAEADVELEAELRAADAAAEQPELLGLADGLLQAPDRQRILRPHVQIALGGADRVGGDRHALEHAVRIALEHAAVHERAGIAFVAVADDELAAAGGPWRRCSTSARSGSRRRRVRAARSG